MKVQDIMTPHLEAITADSTLVQAAVAMKSRDIGFLPVVSASRDVIGVLSDRDMVVRGLASGASPVEMSVGQCASKSALAVRTTDDVQHAARLMRDHKVRRLIVLDDDDHPAGILSLGDLAKHSTDGRLSAQVLSAICCDEKPPDAIEDVLFTEQPGSSQTAE